VPQSRCRATRARQGDAVGCGACGLSRPEPDPRSPVLTALPCPSRPIRVSVTCADGLQPSRTTGSSGRLSAPRQTRSVTVPHASILPGQLADGAVFGEASGVAVDPDTTCTAPVLAILPADGSSIAWLRGRLVLSCKGRFFQMKHDRAARLTAFGLQRRISPGLRPFRAPQIRL